MKKLNTYEEKMKYIDRKLINSKLRLFGSSALTLGSVSVLPASFAGMVMPTSSVLTGSIIAGVSGLVISALETKKISDLNALSYVLKREKSQNK